MEYSINVAGTSLPLIVQVPALERLNPNCNYRLNLESGVVQEDAASTWITVEITSVSNIDTRYNLTNYGQPNRILATPSGLLTNTWLFNNSEANGIIVKGSDLAQRFEISCYDQTNAEITLAGGGACLNFKIVHVPSCDCC